MIHQATISFLQKLKKNNNKPWFDEHKPGYQEAKADFDNFVSALLKKTSEFDNDIKELNPKDCTFRINRDIRFSKNKTPYKTNMGASLNRGGKKSMYAGYYFHLEPGDKSFAGGGLWMPEANELKKVRQEIDYNFADFTQIINDKKFIAVYTSLDSDESKLKNLPRGYENDNPAAEYLKLKSFTAIRNFSDAEILKPSLTIQVVNSFKALKPLIDFLNQAIE